MAINANIVSYFAIFYNEDRPACHINVYRYGLLNVWDETAHRSVYAENFKYTKMTSGHAQLDITAKKWKQEKRFTAKYPRLFWISFVIWEFDRNLSENKNSVMQIARQDLTNSGSFGHAKTWRVGASCCHGGSSNRFFLPMDKYQILK